MKHWNSAFNLNQWNLHTGSAAVDSLNPLNLESLFNAMYNILRDYFTVNCPQHKIGHFLTAHSDVYKPNRFEFL